MSDEFTADFFTYIDRHMSRDQVATALGNSRQTLSSWKSIGIPKGKRFACKALLDSHKAGTSSATNIIIMRPSYDQFQRWNRAALSEGKTIEDWAFDGLEEMAAEHFAKIPTGHPYALPDPPASCVAEEPPD